MSDRPVHPLTLLYGEALPPTLHRDNTALLVVDMQYFDAHPDWGEGRTAKDLGVAGCFDPYFEQIDDIIPRIQRLLALFRHQEMEVIHLRVAELTKDSRDAGWKQLVRGLIVPGDQPRSSPAQYRGHDAGHDGHLHRRLRRERRPRRGGPRV